MFRISQGIWSDSDINLSVAWNKRDRGRAMFRGRYAREEEPAAMNLQIRLT